MACDTGDVETIPLDDTVDGSNDKNLFESENGRQSSLTWKAGTGTATLKLARGAKMLPYVDYEISFSLKNGYMAEVSEPYPYTKPCTLHPEPCTLSPAP